jgi:hypothetical protein
MRKAAYTIAATTALLAVAQAQASLDSAEKTFRAADLNKDGVLTAREAGAASVAPGDFKKFDTDADANMTRDEFVLFYRDLLVRAKQPVGVELVREADRIAGQRTTETGGQQQGANGQTRAAQPAKQAGGQAGGQSGGAKAPNARAEAARLQLQRERKAAVQGAGAADAAKGMEARVVAALADFEQSMQEGTLSAEAFQSMRNTLIEDARRAAREPGGQIAPLTGLQQRLVAALKTIEQRARNGEAGSAAEFKALRDLAIQHAREVDAARKKAQQQAANSPDARAAAARAELNRGKGQPQGQGGASGANAQVGNDLMSALDRLERRALASQATPEDYRQVRERLIMRARKAARKGGANSEEARYAQRLIGALDTLKAKADNGRISQADFAALREQVIAKAREAQAGTSTGSAADASATTGGTPGATGAAGSTAKQAPKHSRRLLQALDTLEKRVLEGNAAPEEFTKLRDLFIAKARAASNNGGTAQDGTTVAVARRLQSALDELQAKTLRGEAKRSDFKALRELMIGDARKSAAGSKGSGNSTGATGSTGDASGATPPANAGTRRGSGAANAGGDDSTQTPEGGATPQRRGRRGGGGGR